MPSSDSEQDDVKTVSLKPDRLAELEELARRRGQTPADALDEAVAAYIEWERQDFEAAVEGIRQGEQDGKAGRVRGAEEFLGELRDKHGLSR